MIRLIVLLVGIFCLSTAVIMIKASVTHPVLLSGYRLLIAAVVLTPLWLRDFRMHRGVYTRRHFAASLLPGAALAFHFITWIIGVRLTSVANSTLIVNMSPVVMPFFLLALTRESLTRSELISTGIVVAALLILGAGDAGLSRAHMAGDAICFGSMLLVTLYLALGRRNRKVPTLWLYLVPLYYFAAILCIALAPIFGARFEMPVPRELALIAGLGLVPTVLGHSIVNYAMKYFRGQTVSILSMLQVVCAAAIAFFTFREIPSATFYAAAILLLCAAVSVSKHAGKCGA